MTTTTTTTKGRKAGSAAAVEAAGAGAGAAPATAAGTGAGVMVSLLLMWALFSTWCDMLNKAILTRFPFPLTLTVAHFGVSAVLGLVALPVLRLHPYQHGPDRVAWREVAPVTLCQALGFLSTNVSFGRVAVSFTQTVKASAPLFSLAISVLVMGQSFSPLTYVSLIPIVGGVALTAATELSFDSLGLVAALVSNVCFTSRSVLSKGVMKSMDGVNLYFFLSCTALAAVLPLWLATDARAFWADPSLLDARLLGMLFVCGALHYAYNQVSFLVLVRVEPLTHAVSNVLRRVAVIAGTIVYFGQEVSPSNAAGIASVFGGVLLYLASKRSAANAAVAAAKKSE